MAKGDQVEHRTACDGISETACGGSSENAVGKMFDRIAPRYALLNHILSFGLDFSWRRSLAKVLDENRPLELLDLATGSGDLLISILRRRGNISKAVGLDISEKMLYVCRRNLEKAKLGERATLIQADAARTGLADNSFDVVTMAFGIRNVADPGETLAEIFRVLRPGGKALILEFSLPSNRLIRGIYLVYLRHIVPFIGRLISRDKTAYRYLNTTIESFHRNCDIPELMTKCGFADIATKRLTLGTVSLCSGVKR